MVQVNLIRSHGSVRGSYWEVPYRHSSRVVIGYDIKWPVAAQEAAKAGPGSLQSQLPAPVGLHSPTPPSLRVDCLPIWGTESVHQPRQ